MGVPAKGLPGPCRTYRGMDRSELLSLVSTATSLNQISSLTAGIRAWLADNPDDEEMRDVFQELTRREREQLAHARG